LSLVGIASFFHSYVLLTEISTSEEEQDSDLSPEQMFKMDTERGQLHNLPTGRGGCGDTYQYYHENGGCCNPPDTLLDLEHNTQFTSVVAESSSHKQDDLVIPIRTSTSISSNDNTSEGHTSSKRLSTASTVSSLEPFTIDEAEYYASQSSQEEDDKSTRVKLFTKRRDTDNRPSTSPSDKDDGVHVASSQRLLPDRPATPDGSDMSNESNTSLISSSDSGYYQG